MKALLLFLALPLAGADIYDILIKNGNVIDPANKRNGRMDVAISGKKIVKVGRDLPASRAKVVIEAGEYYVTPGLIDIHTHFDVRGASLNIDPDHNSLRFGVTTAVDAGSAGADTFDKFYRQTILHAKVRLLAFLDICAAGMYNQEQEDDPKQMNVEKAVAMAKKYPGVIVGIKSAHYRPPDWTSMDNAVKAAEQFGGMVMVDFYPMAGLSFPELLSKHMRPGDILTHFYYRRLPQIDANGKMQSYVREARARGILFDVGHGQAAFHYRVAAPAIADGFLPDTISTDLHVGSVMLPRATMTLTMSKLLNLGLSLEQVIERSTVNSAKAIRRPELGTLSEGAAADIAILTLEQGKFAFLDSGNAKLTGNKRLRAAVTIRDGRVVWDEDGLSTGDISQAGPYSNFK